MKAKLEQIRKSAIDALERVADRDTLFNLEKKFLGRKAELAQVMKDIKSLSDAEKPLVGKLINDIKRDISAIVEKKRTDFSAQSAPGRSGWDKTLPGLKPALGHIHPITRFLEKIEDIFVRMGYEVVEGPEAETQAYNFDLLNFPKDHPARDVQDTFFLDQKGDDGLPMVLRTQTSPVQIRAMEIKKPPVRLLVPGRVFQIGRASC